MAMYVHEVFVILTFYLSVPFVKIQGFRSFDVDGVHTILALNDEDISITCKTGAPAAYCGFIHPTGKRYSFSGLSLADGHCAVKIRATKNDTGAWRCHIGERSIGVEIMQEIKLRVVNYVAAVRPTVNAVHGKEVTLACVTTKEKTPLRYCRFEPPVGAPFSIDSEVKPTQAILGKYYYPLNKSLDRGDCAVTVRNVKYSDVGSWTCGAGLDDGQEHTDVIYLEVEGLYTMSTASTSGITFGTIGIVVFLLILGLIAWKKRRFLGGERDRNAPEIHELRVVQQPSPGSARSQRSQGSQRSNRSRSERSLTPQRLRSVPILTVQSPSEPRSSPSQRICIE